VADYSKSTCEIYEAVLRHLMNDPFFIVPRLVVSILDRALGITFASGVDQIREEFFSRPR